MGCDVVTGGAGFIGSHLVDRLIASGRRVRVLDNFVVGRRYNLRQHDDDPLLEIVETDIADSAAVVAACAGAERTFHLAARADIVPSIQQPEAYFRANVDGTFVMLEAARRPRRVPQTPPRQRDPPSHETTRPRRLKCPDPGQHLDTGSIDIHDH
jgi:UDP-glucose 4-epimerase